MKKLLFILITIGLILVLIKRKDMNIKQSLLKLVYPVFQKMAKAAGSNATIVLNKKNVLPSEDFFALKATSITGGEINFNEWKGKKIMVVNTASDCGYTGQYDDLQKLYETYGEKLVVVGFPANDFKEQEKGTDEEIAAFCRKNFGVTFPLAQKTIVIKKQGQHPVYTWLTEVNKNGWNTQLPEWNFSKYLLDENGKLLGYFGPAVSPMDKAITHYLQ